MAGDEAIVLAHRIGVGEFVECGDRVVDNDGVEGVLLVGHLVVVETLLVPERGDALAGQPPGEVLEYLRRARSAVRVVDAVPVDEDDARERPATVGCGEHAPQRDIAGVDRHLALLERRAVGVRRCRVSGAEREVRDAVVVDADRGDRTALGELESDRRLAVRQLDAVDRHELAVPILQSPPVRLERLDGARITGYERRREGGDDPLAARLGEQTGGIRERSPPEPVCELAYGSLSCVGRRDHRY